MTEGGGQELEGEITIDTLCAHILDGWHNRTRAHDDLRAYHGRLLELMCRELGVEWHDDAKAMRRAWLSVSPVPPEQTTGSDARNAREVRPLPEGSKGRAAGPPMPHVLATICESYSGIEKPLSLYWEYSRSNVEQSVMNAHLKQIDRATDELRQMWQRWLRDLLLIRWPNASTRTSSWERLRELNLGTPVDDSEYI